MPTLPSIEALRDPIYETFYGLREQPFAITTDPRFFYLSASHRRAFGELLSGLRRREGLMLVTGDTGTGKTTLCRAVIDGLGERTFAAMVLNPYMSGAEVFRIVLRDFGLVSHEELRRGVLANADVPQLLDTLEGFLRSLAALDSYAIIVLDEAQSVAPQTLDQIRLLTGLEHHGARLVQVILCGQPGLLGTLATEPMYALNERITRRVSLAPLPPEEVSAYIQHRLTVAGGTDGVAFDPAASRVVADLSHGLPRRVNVLCDRSLQEGRAENAKVITAALVARAARALAGAPEPASDPLGPSATAGSPAVITAGAETPGAGAPAVSATPTLASAPTPSATTTPFTVSGTAPFAAAVTAVPAATTTAPASTTTAAASATDETSAPSAFEQRLSPLFGAEVSSASPLTLGQIPETPRGTRVRRFVLASIGAVAAAVVLGLGYYAYALVKEGYRLPPAGRPQVQGGPALGPRPVPPPDQLPALLAPAPAVPSSAPRPSTVTPVGSPEPAQAGTPTAGPSGQLPDNRNQVN